MTGRVVMLCGLPGSGKTTTARTLTAGGRGIRLCPDEWMVQLGFDLWDAGGRARVEALQWTMAQDLALTGQMVVLEWGVWSRREREAVRAWARAHAVGVELVYLDIPMDELWARVDARNRSGEPNTTVITRAHLEEWAAGPFEAPTPEELALYDQPDGAGPVRAAAG